ncbi:MAG: hypothetical protein ACQETO_02715 [Pseudomonadota bacterium]
MEQAQAKNDISIIDQLSLGPAYRNLGGDAPQLLAHCLNSYRCEHANFIINQQRSSLHRRMSWEMPHLSPTALNHKVGELNERVMNLYYTSTGWRQLPGEVGRNGIDGLFVKYRQDGSIRDVLVSESKYNFSPLGNTRNGTQMSRLWTEAKIDDLYRSTSDPRYLEVQRFVQQGSYRSIVWRLAPSADSDSIFVIQRRRVTDNGGVLSTEEIRGGHRMLVDREANQTIDMNNPLNEFQATMSRSIQRGIEDIVDEEYDRLGVQ